MIKIIRSVVIAGLCISLFGCAVVMRIRGDEDLDRPTDKRFVSTRYDIGVISAVRYANQSAEARIACLAFPFALIDLPIAFVVDVIMLPMDWHQYNVNKEDEAFWSSVFDNPDRLPTVVECCAHASVHSKLFVYERIAFEDHHEKIPGESLHLIIQAANVMNDNLHEWMPVDNILGRTNLLPASWIALYEMAPEPAYSEYYISELAGNPVTPPEYYEELVSMNSLMIEQSLTENPKTPTDILETIARKATIRIQLEEEKPESDTWNLYELKKLLKSAESALASRAN